MIVVMGAVEGALRDREESRMTNLHKVAALGQSIWLDYIRRSLITSGELQELVDKGVYGVTSNPSIFEKAISGGSEYDRDLNRLADEGRSAAEIYEALVLYDIRAAADVLRPVYDETGGDDGYVSLEANPKLAHDTQGTIAEVRHLFAALERPNVMIKVPATPEGIPAIETLTSEGVNVNVTLMFSLAQYDVVAEAYLAGLEKRMATGGDLSRIASVASFFVSRVDTAVDQGLAKLGRAELEGKIGIANAKMAYARFRETFSAERWERLKAEGARVQRPLWGSTSTKSPNYPDTLYVDNLIGPDTVNTVPPETLEAFLDHGRVAPTLLSGLDEAREHLARLSDVGLDLDGITDQLLVAGVGAFAKAFAGLMASIAQKRERVLAGAPA